MSLAIGWLPSACAQNTDRLTAVFQHERTASMHAAESCHSLNSPADGKDRFDRAQTPVDEQLARLVNGRHVCFLKSNDHSPIAALLDQQFSDARTAGGFSIQTCNPAASACVASAVRY